MANIKGGSIIAAKQNRSVTQPTENKSLAAVFSNLIETEGLKNRINEVMGKRANQFTASMVSLVTTGNAQMQEVAKNKPVTIIQACLKAATYDLPIDPALGFAYIVPFAGKANFIMGYKGMLQLAMRTGVYKRINVTDIRESELISYNRLTEDIEIEFITDPNQRNKKPIVGYVGFYRLVNGMEKTIFLTIDEIKAHEKANRKGKTISDNWVDSEENKVKFQAMCMKTVLRKLIGKWGIMSIDYQNASPEVVALAENAAKGTIDDEDDNAFEVIEAETTESVLVDEETGEIVNG